MTASWYDSKAAAAETVAEHMKRADDAIARAEKAASSGLPVAASWAAIAQAHLSAANVKDMLGVSHADDRVRDAIQASAAMATHRDCCGSS